MLWVLAKVIGSYYKLQRCDVAFLWASKVSANRGAMPKSASVDTSFQVSKIQYIRKPFPLHVPNPNIWNNLPSSDKRIDKLSCMQICDPGLIFISFSFILFLQELI